MWLESCKWPVAMVSKWHLHVQRKSTSEFLLLGCKLSLCVSVCSGAAPEFWVLSLTCKPASAVFLWDVVCAFCEHSLVPAELGLKLRSCCEFCDMLSCSFAIIQLATGV